MKHLLILCITLFSLQGAAQEFNLVGTWTLTESESYRIHDTITILEDGSFRSRIVDNSINEGKWRKRWFHSDQFILKSCLHSSDNPYKCRDYKWTWEILEYGDDYFIVLQTWGDRERRLEYKRVDFVLPEMQW